MKKASALITCRRLSSREMFEAKTERCFDAQRVSKKQEAFINTVVPYLAGKHPKSYHDVGRSYFEAERYPEHRYLGADTSFLSPSKQSTHYRINLLHLRNRDAVSKEVQRITPRKASSGVKNRQ